jgi:hypothetical protein
MNSPDNQQRRWVVLKRDTIIEHSCTMTEQAIRQLGGVGMPPLQLTTGEGFSAKRA